MSAWFDARFFGEVFVTLLVIMDPPGSVPVFLSLTGSYARRARNRSADLAVLTALTVIVVFALFGQQVLQYLHVTLAALASRWRSATAAGGPRTLDGLGERARRKDDVNVSMVPLGTPLLAGPGAIAATIVFAKSVHHEQEAVALAAGIIAVHVVLWLTLRFSTVISAGAPSKRSDTAHADRRVVALLDRGAARRRRHREVRCRELSRSGGRRADQRGLPGRYGDRDIGPRRFAAQRLDAVARWRREFARRSRRSDVAGV